MTTTTTTTTADHTFNDDRYDRMAYRRCGRSGIDLPAFSLGGWHNFEDRDVARDLMVRAFDLGINHFDLANNYGPPPGIAETHTGDVLRREFAKHRDELIISSKAGHRMWPGPFGEFSSRKNLLASLDQSLGRLQLDYVDIFYSHRFDRHTPLEETMGALDAAVRQGKALYAGISGYSGAWTVEAQRIARDLGTPLLIHQPNYSMLNRGIENDLLPHTERMGMGVIAYCPLAQGLLSDRYLDGIPDDSRAAKPTGFLKKDRVTSELVAKLRKLNGIAKERGQSLAQLALCWILRDARVTSVLFGASRVSQLEQNVQALDAGPISSEHLTKIDTILSA